MVQPTGLQFLLRRLGAGPTLAWNPMADNLSLLDKGDRQYERTLCSLFNSRQRVRTSETKITSAVRRIITHRIRQKLTDGRLPSQRAAIITGGPGRGGDCDGCEQPLLSTQLVMEIPRGDASLTHLHADCFQWWDEIRRSDVAVHAAVLSR